MRDKLCDFYEFLGCTLCLALITLGYTLTFSHIQPAIKRALYASLAEDMVRSTQNDVECPCRRF